MEKEMIKFISENNLSPFNKLKTPVSSGDKEIFKTKDAKTVYNKVINKISNKFCFADSSCIFNFLEFTDSVDEIKKRQEFFSKIGLLENEFMLKLQKPRSTWKPDYGVIVVTEDEMTFNELTKLKCNYKLLVSEYDLDSLEDYDVVQVLDCENFSRALENLPQAVFLSDIREVYLERYLEELSGWKENIQLLRQNNSVEDIRKIISDLEPLFMLFEKGKYENLNREFIENKLSEINSNVSEKIRQMTISGTQMFEILSKGQLPEEIRQSILEEITKSGLPNNIFEIKIPVRVDEEELERLIKKVNAEKNSKSSERIAKNAKEIIKIPGKLRELESLLVYFDFIAGISKFNGGKNNFPEISDELIIERSRNIFLDNAQAIDFKLDDLNRCSILTGANSGGKTTLLEHIIQAISLFQIGLPLDSMAKIPLFSEVYYFAKNKGSANKGAFETLLTQMSKIKPGKQTLILADEIESVTEPGVAGAIVCASADYFIKKGCFMVVATHLGKEIQKSLPQFARIDGIEAKGLNEENELIVDHNPVLGRLANSTPELIIEKMANTNDAEYLNHIWDFVKKGKN